MDTSPADRFRRVDELFDAVLDLPPAEQTAYLLRACGSDVDLRDEVVRLLRAHRQSEAFLESPALDLAAPLLGGESPLPPSGAPGRAGPFRIVRAVGHGGMGDVYLAERDDGQFQQRVALKLVRGGGRGDVLVRRFLEERRILALLEHPHIARLVDGGLTDGGQPYFAMEYVAGEPIDEYCNARQLSIQRRLELFGDVCDAVQYAHQNLVIHRDLKPANVLVTAAGQLKLLDFGIAKLLAPGSADVTETAWRAMTPEFAAPEQVRGEPVSTATDVYALGVLLYSLLTGCRPYQVRGKSPAEVERIIGTVEPPRPSGTFLAGQQECEDPRTRAHQRGATPERLQRRLRGDLDMIVMKALRKEPERRYASAAALREDLERFRAGRPVRARPDSAGYRARRFVARHRAAVSTAAVTAVALLAATGFSLDQMHVARRQRDAALRDAQRQVAMADVQSVLAGDSRGADGRILTPLERIDLAEQVLTRKYRRDPWLTVEVMANLSGRLYETGDRQAQRGILARARRLARQASLPTQLALVDCLRVYSFAYDERFDSAHIDLAEARTALAKPAARTPNVAALCLDAEGQLLVATDQPDSGLVLLDRALATAAPLPDESLHLQILNDLAQGLRALGRTRKAVDYQRRIVATLDSTGYGATDVFPNVVSFLASSLWELGEFAQTDSILRSLIREQESRVGAGHVTGLLALMHGLGELRLDQLDSAAVWIDRAQRDTTQAGVSRYLPPILAQLRLEQGRMGAARQAIRELPVGTLTRQANAALFGAWLRREDGDVRGASTQLEAALHRLVPEGAPPPPALSLSLVTAAEWRLETGPPQAADSLARLARAAAAVDSSALLRSGYVGRADLVRAQALRMLGDPRGAQGAATSAVLALANAYGPRHERTRQARAVQDSLVAGRLPETPR